MGISGRNRLARSAAVFPINPNSITIVIMRERGESDKDSVSRVRAQAFKERGGNGVRDKRTHSTRNTRNRCPSGWLDGLRLTGNHARCGWRAVAGGSRAKGAKSMAGMRRRLMILGLLGVASLGISWASARICRGPQAWPRLRQGHKAYLRGDGHIDAPGPRLARAAGPAIARAGHSFRGPNRRRDTSQSL